MVHIYTTEYYSVIKKNETLPVVTICMDLEGIMISEISQTKTNTIRFHYDFYDFIDVESIKQMNKHN